MFVIEICPRTAFCLFSIFVIFYVLSVPLLLRWLSAVSSENLCVCIPVVSLLVATVSCLLRDSGEPIIRRIHAKCGILPAEIIGFDGWMGTVFKVPLYCGNRKFTFLKRDKSHFVLRSACSTQIAYSN